MAEGRLLVCCQPAIAPQQWEGVSQKLVEAVGKGFTIVRFGMHYPTELTLATGAAAEREPPNVELYPMNAQLDATWPERTKIQWWMLLSHINTRLRIWTERPDKATPFIDWLVRDCGALLVIRERNDTDWYESHVTAMMAFGKPVTFLDPITLQWMRLRKEGL